MSIVLKVVLVVKFDTEHGSQGLSDFQRLLFAITAFIGPNGKAKSYAKNVAMLYVCDVIFSNQFALCHLGLWEHELTYAWYCVMEETVRITIEYSLCVARNFRKVTSGKGQHYWMQNGMNQKRMLGEFRCMWWQLHFQHSGLPGSNQDKLCQPGTKAFFECYFEGFVSTCTLFLQWCSWGVWIIVGSSYLNSLNHSVSLIFVVARDFVVDSHVDFCSWLWRKNSTILYDACPEVTISLNSQEWISAGFWKGNFILSCSGISVQLFYFRW